MSKGLDGFMDESRALLREQMLETDAISLYV